MSAASEDAGVQEKSVAREATDAVDPRSLQLLPLAIWGARYPRPLRSRRRRRGKPMIIRNSREIVMSTATRSDFLKNTPTVAGVFARPLSHRFKPLLHVLFTRSGFRCRLPDADV